MNLQERIKAFSELGTILRNSLEGKDEKLFQLINKQQLNNPWFTPDNVTLALKAIADELTLENLKKWTVNYSVLSEISRPIRVGVIMAGNIPLVGFHDFISVLISGNHLVAKTSSKDPELMIHISNMLISISSEFREKIKFSDSTLTQFDAVIATGSDNSSRYFEYYFGRYPHIIRKNRNSVAVLEGDETDADLANLGADVFSYFGLGCRNVSKIFIPASFDIEKLFRNWKSYSGIIDHTKYGSNYDFNVAVSLVNKEVFHDNGFLLLKDNKSLASPVSVLNYESYNSVDEVYETLQGIKNKIQCIVGKRGVEFGKSQYPHLWDYADNTDTLEFLLKKNMAGIS
jgi:hypothetical protein